MWLNGLSTGLRNERLPVRFLVRARAWVAGQVPSWGCARGNKIDVSLTHGCFSPSLSPSLPLSLKVNKIFKKRERGRRYKSNWNAELQDCYLPWFIFHLYILPGGLKIPGFNTTYPMTHWLHHTRAASQNSNTNASPTRLCLKPAYNIFGICFWPSSIFY